MDPVNQANIRDRIVARRRARLAAEGHALGVEVPHERDTPLVPFLVPPGVICEVKRRSPSRGAIDQSLDPIALAGSYRSQGARSLSVLTEQDHFAGSLADLINIKRAYPDLAVLRKDFLVDCEDVEISYRAGADAVLLIASVLTADELARLHARATEFGMAALVELHEPDDFDKAAAVKPPLIGINARDLTTFTVDLLTPLRLRSRVTWDHRCVFESGVQRGEDAALVAGSGFAGLLVGEAAVRNPDCVGDIVATFRMPGSFSANTHPERDFWSRLMSRAEASPDRPLVKICGITCTEDAYLAARLGADLLGFNFADSPRRTTGELLRELRDLDILKVAVVVTGPDVPLPDVVAGALKTGLIDAVQFHGDEAPSCGEIAFPYYKVLNLGTNEDAARIKEYHCPRLLIDARDPSARGGTGRRIAPELVSQAAVYSPLWLAGGLRPDNIAAVVAEFAPELVDVSSGLESSPGRKDRELLAQFFRQVSRPSSNRKE
jgi:indole-3-glycerol phosphate synthase/phosphoribosylanthranilate isomerase